MPSITQKKKERISTHFHEIGRLPTLKVPGTSLNQIDVYQTKSFLSLLHTILANPRCSIVTRIFPRYREENAAHLMSAVLLNYDTILFTICYK